MGTLKRPHKQLGMSIFSLMVGLVVSAGLLLAISQLAFVSKRNYMQAKNMIEMNQNGREALEFLKKNIEMAGIGIAQPVPAAGVQLNSTGRAPAYPAAGGYAVLPDWTAIGNFTDSTVQFDTSLFTADATPVICGDYVAANYSNDVQFFSLWSCGQCYIRNPNSPPYALDKSQLGYAASDDMATCCQAGTSACASDANYCNTPNYNCGSTTQGAVYQRLIDSQCVGIECMGADPAANPSGDILTVYFANPGTGVLNSFTGQTIPTNTLTPPAHYWSASFYVDANTNTLLAADSLQAGDGGIPNTNITPNIEYMAIMLGESDLSSTVNSTYSAPQVNRYVRPDTANLYGYRVSAIRVAIVVRSTDEILDEVPASTDITLMYGNDGDPLIYSAPADQYMRKVFVTTIYLKNYTLPVYQTHCVGVGGNYYLKTGGIPFADTWTTNDQCCGDPSCTLYGDLESCEATRMEGNC